MLLHVLAHLPIIECGLRGNFAWTENAIHLPLQDLKTVQENLILMHWYNASKNPITDPLPTTIEWLQDDVEEEKIQYASVEQSLKYKEIQSMQMWLHNLANPKIGVEASDDDVLPVYVNSKIFTLPQSTARVLVSKSSIKAPSSKLANLKYRGTPKEDARALRQHFKSYNLSICDTQYDKYLIYTMN